MRTRTLAPVVLSLLAAACGASSPAGPESSNPAINLTPGPYTLGVTMSATDEPPTGQGVWLTTICPAPLAGWTQNVPVQVERPGDLVVIRAEAPAATFKIELRVVGGTLDGWVAGELTHGSLRLWIGSQNGEFKARTTASTNRDGVLGKVDGTVSMNGSSCTNNGHTWTLRAR